MKILIIEDNDILRDNIKKYLEFHKHTVEEHSSYTGAVHKIML
jgi:DNA-binding response OmpR family regulator